MRVRAVVMLAMLAVGAWGTAYAQQGAYPGKPVRVIVPWPPGGVADVVLRLIAPKLGAELGQPIVIDNKPGAGGVLGDDLVAKANPDGYTLLFTSPAVNMNIAIGRSMPYDLDRDLVPVMVVAWAPMILVATPALNYKDVKDLVKAARASPAKMNYASAGDGSPSHLVMEMFREKAGIDAQHVPYKGSQPAMLDQVAGRVDFHFVNSATAIPFINNHQVTALFVTANKRLKVAPDIPTNAEAGYPDMQASQFQAFFAPRGTPPAVLDRLSAAVNKVLAMPDVVAAMAPYALEIDGTSTPQNFPAVVREDRARWTAVAKVANIKFVD